jgi:hypothetical protein
MKEPQIDKKTRDYLKKWGRREVPTAQVTGGSLTPGQFRGFATLGWIESQGVFPVVGIRFLVIGREGFKPLATVSVALPVTKNTELLINGFLHYVGWDGRVWPSDGDGGWPDTSKEDPEQIKIMLQRVIPPIGSTFTFPPPTKIIPIPILKRTAPYPWAPFEPVPEEESTPVDHLARFRALCMDPSPFAVLS